MTTDGTLRIASPSSLQTIRRCGLAQYWRLTKYAGVGQAPSSPPARLGNAAHEVLEWAAADPGAVLNPDLGPNARRRWRDALEVQAERSRRHPVEAVFGPPDTWPTRALVEERLVIEVERVAGEMADVRMEDRHPEWTLESEALALKGTIDLCTTSVDGHARIIDYKAGEVHDDDVVPGGRYSDQVLIYAALVREVGHDPAHAEVRPIGRRPIEVGLSQATIDAAAEQARLDLDHYNAVVGAGEQESLARPSEDACKWCEFAPSCSPMWSAEASALGELQAVAGSVSHVGVSAKGFVDLRVDSAEGTIQGEVTLARLHPNRIPLVEKLAVGDTVRATGLQRAAPEGRALVARNTSWVRLEREAPSAGGVSK